MTYITILDAATSWQIGFQDSATHSMECIMDLHHTLLFYGTAILIFVSWMLSRTIMYSLMKSKDGTGTASDAHLLEIVWTIIPSLILMSIAIPSFILLYMMDEVIDPSITVKAIGHQWYWSYEYSDYINSENESLAFDSYMVQQEDLELGQFRLLETDNHVILPINTNVRVLCTSADVLHSFAVPSLGMKMDAVPGRLNQIGFMIKRAGTFYGQCSELCGVNHGFMPITIDACELPSYINWVNSMLTDE
jgi:cytochrome c oxidase subunit 2